MSFLSDSEWLCLNDLVLSINSIDSDREFRSTVLKKLRFLIPYESAAFFLSDLSRDLVSTPQEWKTRVFLDPLGIDVPAGMLELYTEKYWQQDMIVAHRNLTRSTVLRESDQLSPGDIDSSYMKDYLGGRHVVNVSFFNDEGFLGSLNLNRKKEEGDFSDREVQILELIEPHLTNRLSKWRVRATAVRLKSYLLTTTTSQRAKSMCVVACYRAWTMRPSPKSYPSAPAPLKSIWRTSFEKHRSTAALGSWRSFSSTRRSSSKTVLAREPAHAL